MNKLHSYAAGIGVSIEYADLRHLERDGDYCHRTRTIRLQEGMLWRLERCVLAHELGHAYYGDEPSMFPHIDARQERRAEAWAAHFLIDLDAYIESEATHGDRIDAIAQDLGVMPEIVEAFERTLSRIGENVYVGARMGAGQWADCFEVA